MKNIFKTARLTIRTIDVSDIDSFCDLMENPNVMNPIPLKALTRSESIAHFKEIKARNEDIPDQKIWAVDVTGEESFIGIAALIKNDDNENEIAYRLREKFWGKGYGTEVADGLINYGFLKLNFELITADVDIKNEKSIKILEKYFVHTKEFFNQKDNCVDRRYKLSKDNWLKDKMSV